MAVSTSPGFRPLQANGRWRAGTAFWYQPDLAEAAARGGDPGWAAEVADVYGAWAAGPGQPWAHAVAARCRALTAPAGQREPHFAEALRWHATGGRPLEAARAQLTYGEWLRREKRRSAAAAALLSAVETAARAKAPGCSPG